ncbi:FAD/NAD(P)-binding protein [Nesterenkonia ebinurensis]|uniref:FAD/NAD(P)-binding protein n=1 Tax=Nesterenkonia ebinurensis TaxID=2608252 RepID=UPI00123DC156|nr:FAD/NAD(P)-binding domain-containing protein [Nesterenkonia ebinurensis]
MSAGSENRSPYYDLLLIGSGPRGLILLQQLAETYCNRGGAQTPLKVLVCDSHVIGTGAVWKPDQSPTLLMNGTAAATTVYQHREPRLDCSVYTSGPTLSDWMESKGKGALLRCNDGYASRAKFGEYLQSAYARLRETVKPHLWLDECPREISALHRDGDFWLADIHQDDETVPRHIRAAAVVLATGHTPSTATPAQAERKRHIEILNSPSSQYVPAGLHTAEDLHRIPQSDCVYVEGLGLGFFDIIALLTEARGGTWQESEYHPGGSEPSILAGSRRGLPFLGRSRVFTPRHPDNAELQSALKLVENSEKSRFEVELWPVISAVLRQGVFDVSNELRRNKDVPEDVAERTIELAEYDFFQWSNACSLQRTCSGKTHHARITQFLEDQVVIEHASVKAGVTLDPRQRAAEYLAPIRNRIRAIIPGLHLQGESYEKFLQRTFTNFSSFIATGPPMLRIEQVLKLAQRGYIRFAGPAEALPHPEGFEVRSTENSIVVKSLVEARSPALAVDKSASPLLRQLISEETASLHIKDAVNLHGLSVSVPEGRVKDKKGKENIGLFAFGIPTEGVYWNTVAGPISDSEHPIFLSAAEVVEAALQDIDRLYEKSPTTST